MIEGRKRQGQKIEKEDEKDERRERRRRRAELMPQ